MTDEPCRARRVSCSRAGGALALLLTLSACDLLGPEMCTTGVVPAIVVEVRDGATGLAAAAGATGVAEDGVFRGELETREIGSDALYLTGLFGRPGSYRVVVEKPGYHSWQREAVRVRRGECHVETAEIRADLDPI